MSNSPAIPVIFAISVPAAIPCVTAAPAKGGEIIGFVAGSKGANQAS